VNRYLIIVEETHSGYSAYSPDVAGCVAAAATRSDVEREMHDAMEFHIEGLRAAGEEISKSRSGKIMETVKKLLQAILSWPVRLFPNSSSSFPTKRSG